MAKRPPLFPALPLRNMSAFCKGSQRPAYRLRERRSKETASFQGEAEGPVDPEDLAFLMVSLCIDHQNREKREKTGYEEAMNFLERA